MTNRIYPSMLLALSLGAPMGCVVTESGDDDAADDESGDDDDGSASNADDAADDDDDAADDAPADDDADDDAADDAPADDDAADDADDDAADDAADSTGDGTDDGDPTGADVDPQEGEWVYDETGETSNDCSFATQPTNGFGIYVVAITSPNVFTITPGDGTANFECDYAGGSYECPERLQGDIGLDQGTGADAVGHIYIGVDGTLQSSTEMSGEQHGRIECEGGDCGLVEQYTGVTFPCEFTVPFVGTAQ